MLHSQEIPQVWEFPRSVDKTGIAIQIGEDKIYMTEVQLGIILADLELLGYLKMK